VDEVTLSPADTRDDDELPIPRLHDAALSEVLRSDIGDTALGHALRRLLNDLNHPQEAISAFGNVTE
jgi:FXSXX-COOH protein